jgi:hypothetical protein
MGDVNRTLMRRLGALSALVAIAAAVAGVLGGCGEDSAPSSPVEPSRPMIDLSKIPKLSEPPPVVVPRITPRVPSGGAPRDRGPDADLDLIPDSEERPTTDSDYDGREDWQEPSGCSFSSDCDNDGIGDANDPP